MSRGITLTRAEEALHAYRNRGDGFRLRITASDNVLMPAEIFLHQQMLINPHTGLQSEEFCAVASPEDFAVYPVDEPNLTQSPPFYRKSVIDVIVASRQQALEVWDAVKTRVCELVEALNRKDVLVNAETSRCGAALVPETSETSETDDSQTTSMSESA